MPTLELPNLARYTYQAYTTPPPIALTFTNPPIGSQSQTQAMLPSRCCPPGLNLKIPQGGTLTAGMKLIIKDINGNVQPLDITGFQFQFTAKTDLLLPDNDPTTVTVDWTETNTPTQGITSLVVPSSTTALMEPMPYFYQLWMIQSPTSPTPIVTPLLSGTCVIIQPVAARR